MAACIGNQGSLWSCYREIAARSVLAVGCVGIALCEEEAVAEPLGEGDKHEVAAVDVGITLLLAIKFRFETKDCSFDVGDLVERAEESSLEEVTLGGSLQCRPAVDAD